MPFQRFPPARRPPFVPPRSATPDAVRPAAAAMLPRHAIGALASVPPAPVHTSYAAPPPARSGALAPGRGQPVAGGRPVPGGATGDVIQRMVFPVPGSGFRKFYSDQDEGRHFDTRQEAEAHEKKLAAERSGPPAPTGRGGPPPSSARPEDVVTDEPDERFLGGRRIERPYPLGFESEEQFRELTRPIARANRDAEIVVTGSSVTGKSSKHETPFRHGRRFVLPPRRERKHTNKLTMPSDIDLGVVKRGSVGRGDVGENGFPLPRTRTSNLEYAYGSQVEAATGHPSGIKFFNSYPLSPGRRHERPRIVRPHTPEPEPDDARDRPRRSRSRERDDERDRGRHHRSRSPDRRRDRDVKRERDDDRDRRHRSRSRERDRHDRDRDDRDRHDDRYRSQRRRSRSPERRRSRSPRK